MIHVGDVRDSYDVAKAYLDTTAVGQKAFTLFVQITFVENLFSLQLNDELTFKRLKVFWFIHSGPLLFQADTSVSIAFLL